MTQKGPAKRYAPVTGPVAVVSGMGGRYTASYRATHVWDSGHEVPPQPDGSFWLSHPDTPDNWKHYTRRELHEASFGRPVPGGFTITGGRTVYDSRGRLAELTTKPVGFGHQHHEEPAVRIDGSLCPVDDLWKHAWQGTLIAPGRVPYY